MTYCNICGVAGATWPEEDGTWQCDACHDGIDQDERVDAEELWNDAVALERGTYRPAPDWRDELDGGDPR